MSKTENKAAGEAQPMERAQGQLFQEMLDAPLYVQIELRRTNPNHEVRGVRLHSNNYDYYCPGCKMVTPWQQRVPQSLINTDESEARQHKLAVMIPPGGSGYSPPVHNWMTSFELTTRCLRGGHQATYYFVVEGPAFGTRHGQTANPNPNFLVKVGQHPSLTDFQLGDLTEFDGLISKQQRREFVRGINCAAHGFAVAACVYYRRVFEGILVEARDEHMAAHGMADWPDFERARTDERIKLLAENLPKFLVDNPHLYSMLSLGVHELTEEQCAEHLPMLRAAIELILRDRMIVVAAKKNREGVEKLLAQAVNRHKSC